MADQPSPAKQKLYIETVGCQMNLLDSELVVAKLRKDGYELTDDLTRPMLFCTTRVRSGSTPKTRFTVHSGGSSGSRSASRSFRSVCWAAWLRKIRSRSSGARHMLTWSSGPVSLERWASWWSKSRRERRSRLP